MSKFLENKITNTDTRRKSLNSLKMMTFTQSIVWNLLPSSNRSYITYQNLAQNKKLLPRFGYGLRVPQDIMELYGILPVRQSEGGDLV